MSTPPGMTDNREPFTPKFEPGFFTEASARGAPSRWKDGDKVRFKNGIPEKMGGWEAADITGDTHYGVGRRIHEWTSLDGEAWAAEGTNSKLYLINRNVRYDITPVRRNIDLTDPFTTTSGSAIVVVDDTAHSAQAGDAVRYVGAVAVGGITITGEYFITEIIDGDSYTITHSVAAASDDSGGGSVIADYDINAGTADETLALGYGVCKYGESFYGTARSISCSGVKRKMRIWSLDNFGEDLIASPRGGAVYHWDRTLGPLTRAVLLPDAPQTNQHVLVSNSGGQIICLGAFDEVAGSPDPMFIRIGAEESLTDFTVSDDESDTVFEIRVSTGSEIITGARTSNGVLVCTNSAVYILQEDAQEVFILRKIAEGNSAIGPNALIEVDGTAYLMAPFKFMLFDGVYTEIPCDVWEHVFKNIDRTQTDKVYAWYNEPFSEIWWLYPNADGVNLATESEDDITTEDEDDLVLDAPAENNSYVIYNKELKRWYFGSIERTAAGNKGPIFGVPFAVDASGNLFLHETGTDDDTAALDAFIESHDIQIGEGKTEMTISKVVPDMLRQAGDMLLTLSAKHWPNDEDYVVKGPYTLTITTRAKGVKITGRQVAVKYESDAIGDDWRLGDWTFYISPDKEG